MLVSTFIRFSVFLILFVSCDVFAQVYSDSSAPWDYRDPRYKDNLAIVDKYHFNLDVQLLRSGQSSDFVGPDLVFILRYFPNHYPALDTMMRLWRMHERGGAGIPTGLSGQQTPDSYFERAIEFVPDDGVVRMLYGAYLLNSGQLDRALMAYETALNLEPDSPEVHYNAGLFYVETGNLEAAMRHAEIAYEMGYPLPGLRKRLESAGAWREPEQ